MSWESFASVLNDIFEKSIPWNKTVYEFTSNDVVGSSSKYTSQINNTEAYLAEITPDKRKEIVYRQLFQIGNFLNNIDDLIVNFPSLYRIAYGNKKDEIDSDQLTVELTKKIKVSYERGFNPRLSTYKNELLLIVNKSFAEYFKLETDGSVGYSDYPNLSNGEYDERKIEYFLLQYIVYPIFYQAIHYTEYLQYIKKTKEAIESSELDSEELSELDQIPWTGTPGEFGAIMHELIQNGYIPTVKNLKSTVRLLYRFFKIQNDEGEIVDFDYLYRCFHDKKKQYLVGQKPRITKSDNYDKDK